MVTGFGALLLAAAMASQGGFSRVAADASALPAEKRFVAEMLTNRIEARTPGSDAAKPLAVRFALDDAVKGENAVVTVKDGTATIRARRFRGLVFGAGLLLRTARYGEKTFSLDDGEYRFEPKKSLRMCYMARHFLNWYHMATPDELTTYIDDLALSGHNAFDFQCELPTPGRNGNFEKASLAAVNRVHALDCGFCSGGGNNQAPEDSPEELRGVPNSDPKRGNLGFNVCISKPEGMEYLCRLRKDAIAKLAGSSPDYFCYWPFDEGGCECDGCKPWGGNGFLRLIERFSAMNRAAFPKAKTIISTWVFHDDDWEGLYKWLETHDGVDYILADSHTDFPKYPLEHPTPKGIPIMTFPEISMWGRAPWGGYGATALPKRFARLFRQVERIADGFMSYSEGLYEDINKEVVNGLYIDPKADTDDLLRSYAAYYLPGTDPEDFVKLCDIFETNHKFPGGHSHPSFKGVAPDSPELAEYRRRAAEACRIAERMDGAILTSLKESWRWRLVYLRAMIDREIISTCQGAPESARKYFEELVKMYHAERQLADWRKTGKRGWTTPQFK
ncbi:MAG: hypothetical protein IJH50_12005 [Kiritimatiellae bacterium]|nr:hypothetical protein [Kiritimatiellia bacterium]